MKILAMIMLVLLILAVGFVGYVYKKNAMFLPALFGIGGFPNIKKKDYYQADGTFRKAENLSSWTPDGWMKQSGISKLDASVSSNIICFLMLRITC